MDQAGKGGGGSVYGGTANDGGTQDGGVDGDSMAKEKPSDLCRAEGEADEEVVCVVRSS